MKKLNIIYGCLVLVLLVSMCSCGARKVNIEKQKEVSHTEISDNSLTERKIDTNVKTTTTVKVDDKNQTVTEETILEPADPKKESFIIENDGTKVVLNNVKKTVKKTTQNNNTAVVKESLTTESKKEAVSEQKAVAKINTSNKETKEKQVDKKQFNPFFSICIVAIGLILIWCVYRFYKKLPLVPKL